MSASPQVRRLARPRSPSWIHCGRGVQGRNVLFLYTLVWDSEDSDSHQKRDTEGTLGASEAAHWWWVSVELRRGPSRLSGSTQPLHERMNKQTPRQISGGHLQGTHITWYYFEERGFV